MLAAQQAGDQPGQPAEGLALRHRSDATGARRRLPRPSGVQVFCWFILLLLGFNDQLPALRSVLSHRAISGVTTADRRLSVPDPQQAEPLRRRRGGRQPAIRRGQDLGEGAGLRLPCPTSTRVATTVRTICGKKAAPARSTAISRAFAGPRRAFVEAGQRPDDSTRRCRSRAPCWPLLGRVAPRHAEPGAGERREVVPPAERLRRRVHRRQIEGGAHVPGAIAQERRGRGGLPDQVAVGAPARALKRA